jgi:hypothetical protein
LLLNIPTLFLILILIPRVTIAADEACYPLGVNILAIYPKSRLFSSSGTLLLLANHQVDFFSLDVFADMPCGEAVFILFFSANGMLDFDC